MKVDKKIIELEQLLKTEKYLKQLKEFENMINNVDNNWKIRHKIKNIHTNKKNIYYQ